MVTPLEDGWKWVKVFRQLKLQALLRIVFLISTYLPLLLFLEMPPSMTCLSYWESHRRRSSGCEKHTHSHTYCNLFKQEIRDDIVLEHTDLIIELNASQIPRGHFFCRGAYSTWGWTNIPFFFPFQIFRTIGCCSHDNLMICCEGRHWEICEMRKMCSFCTDIFIICSEALQNRPRLILTSVFMMMFSLFECILTAVDTKSMCSMKHS